ncbi:MAG TPA: GTP-binding protein, partial [Chroococcales cyanobacterium]
MHETADQHVYERILGNNEEMAEHNRDHFDELGIFAVNLMSAPGAGKTSLLEHAIPKLAEQESVAVVEGDMVGELDAQRLRSTTTPVIQITTGRSCHLDALMVARVLHNDDFAG